MEEVGGRREEGGRRRYFSLFVILYSLFTRTLDFYFIIKTVSVMFLILVSEC